MSSDIEWSDSSGIGLHTANVGPYCLFVMEIAVVLLDKKFIWGVCMREGTFEPSGGFGPTEESILVKGEENITHTMTLIGNNVAASTIAVCKHKAEKAFREIDATRLAEETFLKDD